jgi:hypothetical protein
MFGASIFAPGKPRKPPAGSIASKAVAAPVCLKCARAVRVQTASAFSLDPTDRLRLDGDWSGGINKMGGDDNWKVAEAALAKARGLPGGAERIEALKQAGRLRFEADQRRQKKELRQHGPPSHLANICPPKGFKTDGE